MKNLKRVLELMLITIFVLMTPFFIKTANSSPIAGGGDLGLGLEVGDPGAWGASGKLWLDKDSAFQGAVKLGDGTTFLQLDYLLHDYGIIYPKNGLLPFYLGLGGDLSLQNNLTIGARGVLGVTYLFNRDDVPVDIFIQVAPTLWFLTGGTQFDLYGELGSRFYF